jgi:K+/H+ antiporter YhaU regulatory subunit KhtT
LTATSSTHLRQRPLKRLDGRLEFNPAPDTVIEGGDCLIGIGSSDHLEKLESLAQA